jgi:hypothetical protein
MSDATFSLRTLMVLVTLSAVGCFALAQHTPWWASIMLTLTYGLLLLGTLSAVVRNGSGRVFWLGFAVSGWAYAIVVCSPLLFPTAGTLLTTRALIAGWQFVGTDGGEAEHNSSVIFSDLEARYNDIMTGLRLPIDTKQHEYVTAVRAYLLIGQSLWTLALGFATGWVATAIHRRERRRDAACC